ncbi:unnamed protein product [Cladocopium goreaui]|uniref:NAD-dependent epimerase/dehydratase domain-containing protein n=1 Tax=Cladocopium goreaui TaxID=2562237 RepID=A0A9P1G9I7_9DINO|nr:unnamed protein product [Cladocopium goreaui]
MAQLLLDLGRLGDARPCNEERDACGPDDPTALELFRHLATSVGAWSRVSAPGVLSTRLVTRMTQPINWITGDILLDGDDLDLLCSGLTVAEVPSDPDIASRRSLMTWIREAGDRLGEEYVSSMKRYYYAR